MHYVDFHNHTMYGIDHGIQTREESLAMYDEYQRQGFDTICVTPHVYHPTVKSNIGAIREHFADIREECSKRGIKAILGAELYLESQMDVKTIPINGRYALVEFDPMRKPLMLEKKLEVLLAKGLQIVIAHVERFQWVRPGNENFKALQNLGVLFQINVADIENKSADIYLKEGIGDLIASDNHGDLTLPGRLRKALDEHPWILSRMQDLDLY